MPEFAFIRAKKKVIDSIRKMTRPEIEREQVHSMRRQVFIHLNSGRIYAGTLAFIVRQKGN
jgi:hypothetical protein